jgi:hypothetical protein
VQRLAAFLSILVVLLFGTRQLLRRYIRGQLLISPAVATLLTAVVVLAVTGVAFLLPAIWPRLDQAIIAGVAATCTFIADAWHSRPQPTPGMYTGARFGWAFLFAASAVWAISAGVLRNVRRGIPVAAPNGGKAMDPMMLMQNAATREDVIDAVGRYDVARRGGVESAMRADFGFAAAYALFFTAVGVLLAIYGMPAGLIVCGLGIGAAIGDMRENQAVLAALAAIPAWEPPYSQPLTPAPLRFSKIKWTLFGGASLMTLAFTIYAIVQLLRSI